MLPNRPEPESARGFSLVIVLAGITVMMILMGVAVPTWRHVMQDDREQELYFRGDQIARAVEEYQRKNGNAFPPSFDVLVKGKYLRRQYKDPMVKDGKWRIVRPGEAMPVSATPAGGTSPRGGASPGTGASPRPSPSPSTSAFGPAGGTSVGVIVGVASFSHDASLRLFNGRTRYDQWLFLAGQPRLLGRNQVPGGLPGGTGASGMPPASPRPLR